MFKPSKAIVVRTEPHDMNKNVRMTNGAEQQLYYKEHGSPCHRMQIEPVKQKLVLTSGVYSLYEFVKLIEGRSLSHCIQYTAQLIVADQSITVSVEHGKCFQHLWTRTSFITLTWVSGFTTYLLVYLQMLPHQSKVGKPNNEKIGGGGGCRNQPKN